MRAVELTLLDKLAIGDFNRVGDQPVAGSKCEVIPQVFIAIEVNLTGALLNKSDFG
ncbi:Uncharacterised protein [Raoultella terrigena]|uniref:Uncharacterized protein n=1 Tax=Raoultella terrigena TaxID=577 RepID=A0A4U9CSG8_RAOTE|nr:Uncharacterised protein [Raoultella terrigena]